MSWYFDAFKKYAVFSGRARRTEYWLFLLFNTIVNLTLMGIVFVFATMDQDTGSLSGMRSLQTGAFLLSSIYSLAALLPSFAVLVRRLHDSGRSGWWFWIALIPLVGFIALIVFLCQDSEPGENKYGPNPKMVSA